MSDKISGSLQENLLTLLVFDEKHISLISNSIEPGLFESDFYKEIVRVALEYYKEFKVPPKEHIADLLESKINDTKNPKSGEFYSRLITNLFQTKESINPTFVISQLNQFVRRQRLKGAIVEAALLIKDETNESLVIAENTLNKTLKNQIKTFDRGLSFSNPNQIMQSLRETLIPAYPFGVKHIDDLNIGPVPGELLVVLAPANRGKTWSLINIGKHCLQTRLKILHISLEMSESKIVQRYLQAIGSLSQSTSENFKIEVSEFAHDELHRLSGLQISQINRPSIKDATVQAKTLKTLEKYKGRIPLEIKRFPTSALTIEGLEVFLDSMDRLYNYTPDVLLLDYADLMKLDYKNLRTSTGDIYKELRRVGVERNIAMVTASQANRLAEDARVITLKHLAEDYSKAATADTIIAFCQTPAEKNLKLARLFVAKARNEENGQTVLISQAYGIGQFCMDSTLVNDRYWSLLDASSTDGPPPAETPRPRFQRRGQQNDS